MKLQVYWAINMALICGIDEAGRGCVAGSLFIASVMLDECYFESFKKLDIRDSKQLTQTQRQERADSIQEFLREHGGRVKIVSFDSINIDSKGLGQCMQMGLKELLLHAQTYQCKSIIFDGNTNFGLHSIETLIKGDSKHVLISAASILAKTNKDSEMLTLHDLYPQYNLKSNKGYLTKAHIESIAKHGYSPVHRKSYHIKALESRLF